MPGDVSLCNVHSSARISIVVNRADSWLQFCCCHCWEWRWWYCYCWGKPSSGLLVIIYGRQYLKHLGSWIFFYFPASESVYISPGSCQFALLCIQTYFSHNLSCCLRSSWAMLHFQICNSVGILPTWDSVHIGATLNMLSGIVRFWVIIPGAYWPPLLERWSVQYKTNRINNIQSLVMWFPKILDELWSTVGVAELTPVCLRCCLSWEPLLSYINIGNEDCVVRPDNLGHYVVNFWDVRLVNILTQNPVQVSDSFFWSSKRTELVRFLSQVAVHWDETISFN